MNMEHSALHAQFDKTIRRIEIVILSMKSSVNRHWPEYLIEVWLLGCFMILAGFFVTLFEYPRSPLCALIAKDAQRMVLLATCIGLTLTLLIQSPWGKRSGAHMNPAITLAFLRLKKIHPWDAVFYILAQAVGGIVGVLLTAAVLGSVFKDPPIHYAATVPGAAGEATAFVAETLISFVLMATILGFVSSPRLGRFTALAIGVLVAVLIVVEAPLSGTSMNPARSLASAVPGGMWRHLWIYLLGPSLGMLIAAEGFSKLHDRTVGVCAKLLHPRNVRCIHCGYLCHQDETAAPPWQHLPPIWQIIEVSTDIDKSLPLDLEP